MIPPTDAVLFAHVKKPKHDLIVDLLGCVDQGKSIAVTRMNTLDRHGVLANVRLAMKKKGYKLRVRTVDKWHYLWLEQTANTQQNTP